MGKLASAVWKDATTAVLLGLHGKQTPSDAEWDRYCSFITEYLPHPNGICVVLTDGGTPTVDQRDRLRDDLKGATRWTAVITDKVLVRCVVTANRWFNPQVCAFSPWDFADALKFVGLSSEQVPGICEVLRGLDQQLEPPSRALIEALRSIRPPDR